MSIYAEHPECDTGDINPAAALAYALAIACNLPWRVYFGIGGYRLDVYRPGTSLDGLASILSAQMSVPVWLPPIPVMRAPRGAIRFAAPLSMEEADIVASGMLEPTTGGNP